MSWWAWLLVGLALLFVGLVLAVFLGRLALKRLLRHPLLRRTSALPLRAKLVLAGRLWRDPRVPRSARLLLPLLIIYLALPVDLIPDFIPVVGYLDDIAVLVLVGLLFLRALPPKVIEEHLAAVESRFQEREVRNGEGRGR
jgi:uncharacterized membrane protein YkvA (DUF1232 family)